MTLMFLDNKGVALAALQEMKRLYSIMGSLLRLIPIMPMH